MTKTVALIGEKGAGKDSFFDSLARTCDRMYAGSGHARAVYNLKLARPLADIVYSIVGTPAGYSGKEDVVVLDLMSNFTIDKLREGLPDLNPDQVVFALTQACNESPNVERLGGGVYRLTRRTFMQLLGNEAVKPVGGDDYWACRAAEERAEILGGTFGEWAFIITDVRYPIELSLTQQVVGVVRSDNLRETLDPEVHPSETLGQCVSVAATLMRKYGDDSGIQYLRETYGELHNDLWGIVESYKDQSGKIKFRGVWVRDDAAQLLGDTSAGAGRAD